MHACVPASPVRHIARAKGAQSERAAHRRCMHQVVGGWRESGERGEGRGGGQRERGWAMAAQPEWRVRTAAGLASSRGGRRSSPWLRGRWRRSCPTGARRSCRRLATFAPGGRCSTCGEAVQGSGHTRVGRGEEMAEGGDGRCACVGTAVGMRGHCGGMRGHCGGHAWALRWACVGTAVGMCALTEYWSWRGREGGRAGGEASLRE